MSETKPINGHDPLDGFRDKTPEELERELKSKLGDRDYLVDFWQMGEAMHAYVQTPAGALLVAEMKDGFNRALKALLESKSIDGTEIRDALTELRVHWKVLGKIDETLMEGAQALRAIEAADREQPEGDDS